MEFTVIILALVALVVFTIYKGVKWCRKAKMDHSAFG